MGRRPFAPEQLRRGAFTIEQARAAGLTRFHLESREWRRLTTGVYAWAGLPDGPLLEISAACLRLPLDAVVAGRSAAWLHGLDVRPTDPVELFVTEHSGVTSRVGVAVRRAHLEPADVTQVQGVRSTAPCRTLFDLSSRLPFREAIVAADSALRIGLVSASELATWADRHPRAKGIRAFRRVVENAEPLSESPMETRLRVLLVLAGLPRPEAQVDLVDEHGEFLGRADLYYPGVRLAIEYDGSTHRESLVEDNRRQNRILAAGYSLLRFSAADLRTPAAIVAQVRGALPPGYQTSRSRLNASAATG